MKNIFAYALTLLLLTLPLKATLPTLESAPKITYGFLKENIDMSAQYSDIEIDEERWHLHWHMDHMPNLETTYPEDKFTVNIKQTYALNDSSVGGFASYDIVIINNVTGTPSSLPFPFYLSRPIGCTISHRVSKMYDTPKEPAFGFNYPLGHGD